MIKLVLSVTSLCFLLSIATVRAESKLEICDSKLQNIENSTNDLTDRIRMWSTLEKECGGTGLHEYQLGKYYIANRDYANALKIIEKGLTFESDYAKELFLSKGDIYLHQKNYPLAEKSYRSVVKKYPKWWAGYNYLGFSLFAQGRDDEAIKYLTQSNQLSEHADAYRTLTLAYYLMDKHLETIDSLNRAFSLDGNILADRDPMVAGIRSYAEVGKYEISRKLLAMLLQNNPDIKNDQEYLKAGRFVREKMIKDGLIEK